MNNSAGNFTTPETSTNTTSHFLGLVDYLEIYVYSINFLFGLPTHSYVLWLIVTRTASGVASEFFILNLFVCELGICLNGLVLVLSMWFASLLKFELFLVGFSMAGRPLFQCLISVERYLAVVHPVTFLKYKPLRYRVVCCTVVWIITLGSCLLCMFFFCLRKQIYTYVAFIGADDTGPLHPVVLSCGCSQSSEAVRTRRQNKRERGGKPHEEKSVSYHSNNYYNYCYHVCAKYNDRIL